MFFTTHTAANRPHVLLKIPGYRLQMVLMSHQKYLVLLYGRKLFRHLVTNTWFLNANGPDVSFKTSGFDAAHMPGNYPDISLQIPRFSAAKCPDISLKKYLVLLPQMQLEIFSMSHPKAPVNGCRRQS